MSVGHTRPSQGSGVLAFGLPYSVIRFGPQDRFIVVEGVERLEGLIWTRPGVLHTRGSSSLPGEVRRGCRSLYVGLQLGRPGGAEKGSRKVVVRG